MNPWDRIIQLVVSNLPPDIQQRSETLDSLLAVMPPEHEATKRVRESLGHLSRHIIAQREFGFSTAAPAQRGGKRLADQKAQR